ncbi:hypothetical protein GCM10011519_10080 [Marmoricola endophyticus]|uniref:Integral membrane protein n=1 Tax=Marmoricola endophyticus TaxID=2040280 RepID=A0A917BDJ1_9ACTN|nr:hypothetical protein [Marmoricola endophyticus]GGF38470.1 hypothetical protein GCM10011519_10080 [Marmoricola endophyticus]
MRGGPAPAPRDAAASEEWFLAHGLPYFVDEVRARVHRRLRGGRLAWLGLGAVVLAFAVGTGVGLLVDDLVVGVALAPVVVAVLAATYLVTALEGAVLARWAFRRAFDSLGLLLPLATRALPMLLLFVTFLFINAEVWQLASALPRGVLWWTVVFFTGFAIFFLVTRLDQELEEFDDQVDSEQLLAATEGTAWEASARGLVGSGEDVLARAHVRGLEKANLLLVLLVSQALQVLLLSVAVFAFFMVFGILAVQDSVVEAWIGRPPTYLGSVRIFSLELTQVAIFLAGFSALYFTVTVVTDDVYRKEFFTRVRRELEQAVAVRIVYRDVRRRDDRPGGPASPA